MEADSLSAWTLPFLSTHAYESFYQLCAARHSLLRIFALNTVCQAKAQNWAEKFEHRSRDAEIISKDNSCHEILSILKWSINILSELSRIKLLYLRIQYLMSFIHSSTYFRNTYIVPKWWNPYYHKHVDGNTLHNSSLYRVTWHLQKLPCQLN